MLVSLCATSTTEDRGAEQRWLRGAGSQGVTANHRGGGGKGVQISARDQARNRADLLQKRMPKSRSMHGSLGGDAENTLGKKEDAFLALLGDLA